MRDINVVNALCNGVVWKCGVLETGTRRPHRHLTVAVECNCGDGGTDFMTAWHVSGVPVGCTGVSIVIEMGTLMTGFVGPIPSGCLIVSKMQVGFEVCDFGADGVCKCVFVGYIDGLCF